eukprot:COSAG01_NODE_1444_length_10282_cov_17.103506_6_plen_91_part_00
MSSDVHPTRTAEHGTYGRWRVARVQGYGIVAAAAACMPACSEGITAVIAPLGTVLRGLSFVTVAPIANVSLVSKSRCQRFRVGPRCAISS